METVLAEGAYSAVKITARRSEEKPAQCRQHRVAEIAMQRRHRPVVNAAKKPVAHYQIATIP